MKSIRWVTAHPSSPAQHLACQVHLPKIARGAVGTSKRRLAPLHCNSGNCVAAHFMIRIWLSTRILPGFFMIFPYVPYFSRILPIVSANFSRCPYLGPYRASLLEELREMRHKLDSEVRSPISGVVGRHGGTYRWKKNGQTMKDRRITGGYYVECWLEGDLHSM